MPLVKFYKSDVSLQWIVKQFETIRHNEPNQILSDKFIPRPDAAIVFHFKSIPEIVMPVGFRLQPCFVAPVVSVPNLLQMEGELDGFIVVCKATVLSRIFKLDMLAKPDRIVELPAEIFTPLWKKLKNITSDLERIECFSEFIQSFAPHGYTPDYVDLIYNDIAENILKFTLHDINEHSFQSISSLQRNFNKRVGVSMKRLVRISRLNYIFKVMLNGRSFDAKNLMFDGNYYDQSHFIKDFKELTGETPKQFFRGNTELCRTLSGMFKGDLSAWIN
ncbi:MAG: AraC family transcriptional regulator [Bacteroidales bacterium]|nr:AraC family transcriptional regulator [Bacteroidales bacterium]